LEGSQKEDDTKKKSSGKRRKKKRKKRSQGWRKKEKISLHRMTRTQRKETWDRTRREKHLGTRGGKKKDNRQRDPRSSMAKAMAYGS